MEKNYEENDCYEEKNQEVKNPEDKLLIQKREPVCSPWRRYFARILDLNLYTILLEGFLSCILGVNLYLASGVWMDLALTILAAVLMLIAEPLLLFLTGTTPGKWILGLRLEKKNGERISYGEALGRTWEVTAWGLGFGIPLYSLYCMVKSYQTARKGEMLPWEGKGEIELVLKDGKVHRGVVYVAAGILLFALQMLLLLRVPLPPNRGELTVAEFAENYNFYTDFYEHAYYGVRLGKTGEWEEISSGASTVMVMEEILPVFHFQEDDGELTKVTLRLESDNTDLFFTEFAQQRLYMILAFLGAQKDARPFFTEAMQADRSLNSRTLTEDFSFTQAGLLFTSRTELENYMESDGYIWKEDEEKPGYFLIEFSVEKGKEE